MRLQPYLIGNRTRFCSNPWHQHHVVPFNCPKWWLQLGEMVDRLTAVIPDLQAMEPALEVSVLPSSLCLCVMPPPSATTCIGTYVGTKVLLPRHSYSAPCALAQCQSHVWTADPDLCDLCCALTGAATCRQAVPGRWQGNTS